MKRIVPSFWTFVFGIFWTLYCAQAMSVLHGPTSAAIPISVETGVQNTEFRQIPQVHAPYDPNLHSQSTAGILPLEEVVANSNEEETERGTKSGQATTLHLSRFLTATTTGQVRPSHRRRCESNIPRYLLLGNLRIHDCVEGLIR